MSYAKILAPLIGASCDANAVATALAAAKPFGAHVEALFVRPDPTEAMPFFGEGVSGVVVQEIFDAAKDVTDEASKRTRAMLEKMAAASGITIVDRPVRDDVTTVSWREVQGNLADQVTQASRLSDLVVFGPLTSEEKPGLIGVFEATLLETGRPLLLAAHQPPRELARRIAVGWDASVPCARAITAAMPFLEKAAAVEILTICHGSTPEGIEEVCEYLALHGVEARPHSVDAGQRQVGAVLLEAALAADVDLLVLGGYGHTRLRQMFFGGVTRNVVSHAQLPLFLVH